MVYNVTLNNMSVISWDIVESRVNHLKTYIFRLKFSVNC